MFRRVLGSFRDAAWLRRQFTRDADLVHDLRYGARLLWRSPGFTLLTTTVLALGIGATTAIFSVVDALLVRQLPYREPERIVLLFEAAATNRAALEAVAPANVIDWQAQARSVERMAAVEPYGFTYTGESEPQSFPAARVTEGFFEIFGLNPLHGRTFTHEEYTVGRNQVVVLSYGTWAQRFGADPGIVGRAIRLNGQPYTVVGEGAAIALVGIGLGLAGALIIGQFLRSFLFGIGPSDPWTLAGVCAALGAVAAIACLLPALRATRVSPLVALRTE